MSAEIECRKCGNNLGQWNNERDLWIDYCPYCGTRLLKKQSGVLHRKTTVEEIPDMIQARLLDVFSDRDGMDVSAEELADLAWEYENCNGVVFSSNYKADQFVARHMNWVDEALVYIDENFGDIGHYAKMKADCNDRFLVVAFICATEYYVFNQLGINRDEGDLTEKLVEEIKRLIETTVYNGEF
jgi:DNA-directed RNA polymerase subunit RPC12/RpoP